MICWIIAAVMLALEAVRLLGLDSRSTLLIAVSTAWPLVASAGLVVAVGALLLRWKSLGGAALVCLVIAAAAWFPVWTGRVGPGAPGAGRVRLLALNVQYDHDTGAAVTRQVEAVHPDVVVLTELSALTLRHLDLSNYGYSWQRPQATAFGQGVWSRWPLVARTTWSESGIAMVEVTVQAPTRSFRLFQVHTHSPTGANGRTIWKSQLKHLDGLLDTERLPLVAAGDFNASRWDGAFGDLLGGRNHVVDAGTGRGYRATWPSGRSRLPPVLPLDHVLISRAFGVRDIRVLGPVGSDHRGLLADLTISADG